MAAANRFRMRLAPTRCALGGDVYRDERVHTGPWTNVLTRIPASDFGASQRPESVRIFGRTGVDRCVSGRTYAVCGTAPKAGGAASSAASTNVIARSASAVIVSEGFTPMWAGTTEPSQTSRFS